MPEFTLSDGVKLYYEVFGPDLDKKDVETIVFSHGGPGFLDGRSYYDFWKQFVVDDSVRVIFPDQRGSGRSDDPDDIAKLNVVQHSKDVRELCEGLNIEKPIVAGVSQGGYVSISYAEQFPDDTAGMIISNSEAKRNTKERVKAYRSSLEKFFGQTAEKAEELSKKIRELDANWDAEEYGALFGGFYSKKGEQFIISDHPATLNKFMGEEFGSLDLEPGLSNIICPVLYMAGEFDCVHPPACAKRTKDLMVNASSMDFHIVKGSADPVYVDKWDESKQLVSDFIEKVLIHIYS